MGAPIAEIPLWVPVLALIATGVVWAAYKDGRFRPPSPQAHKIRGMDGRGEEIRPAAFTLA